MSQIVIGASSADYHRLCVARDFALSHNVTMTDDDKNGGPNNLKAWREYRQLSQAELAERVGTNANMIGYLESGERGLMRRSLGSKASGRVCFVPRNFCLASRIWLSKPGIERRQSSPWCLI